MSISDLIAAEAEAAERNRDAAITSGAKVTRGHQRAKTLQVRLNAEELDALTLLAEQRGMPVSTLARDLLLAQLAGTDTTTKALIAKIRAELDDLATRVA
ncbi:MAG: ribbon-helix-helix protein, CopG family [Propionibacteriaceae bacterium]|nr:ribbon-helix-helix protein, CopG family [Propionibacteriaceae bacterium]